MATYDIKTEKKGLQKGNMHFNTIFLTPYLFVTELKTKLMSFSLFNICQPRPQRPFYDMTQRKDLFFLRYVGYSS